MKDVEENNRILQKLLKRAVVETEDVSLGSLIRSLSSIYEIVHEVTTEKSQLDLSKKILKVYITRINELLV